MQKISAYILTYNEAEKIEAAVSSVLWADEVVVIDSFSADRTAEIATSLGARVVEVPFNGFGELRNRAIRLLGYGRLSVTTQALDEAGQRVSRYLLAQFIVNACLGVTIGLGLFLLGVPYALLWGFLIIILRFVPYLGPMIAAVLERRA